MKNTLRISLKANEKIYVNGAVIRADRKTTLEFLNDVQFLLENHVLQPEDATTPLRQLYFIVQVMLMARDEAQEARTMFRRSLPMMLSCYQDPAILAGLKDIDRLVGENQIYEALKTIRALYPREAEVLDRGANAERFPPLALVVGG
ncbi:flagellar biosynthesis repressor FlbT [Aquibium sp. A9E412]|uniref:flagellar biosynthesis repressor FlbT n=1 Tax=Aquibium sp. A9E412 TaxID=2976767 RepID=UPI0025B0CA6B|nr:flagellar biosynthesis repressor FlbT [Aquibium sp. A9E412]MDN2567256.1 flagellar biosynthesis repressor FlbT [Aquibium sp. A9E412]